MFITNSIYKTWSSYTTAIPIKRSLWEKLYRLYDSPSDIDLFTAGLAEDQMPDGHVGATFGCIIASQFEALKFCDRYCLKQDS
jgi:hypothetical protein